MNSEFVARFQAFNKGDAPTHDENIMLEVTEVVGTSVELGFNSPLPGKHRAYITVDLAELLRHAMPDKS